MARDNDIQATQERIFRIALRGEFDTLPPAPLTAGNLERVAVNSAAARSLCDSSSLHSATPTQKGQHRHA